MSLRTITLYIRDSSKHKRKADLHSGFVVHGSPTNYQQAVKLGQIVAGYGNFYVYTGELSAPSREDQLLLEAKPQRRLSHKLLAALMLD